MLKKASQGVGQRLTKDKILTSLCILLVFFLPFERIPTFELPFANTSLTIRLSQIVALMMLAVFAMTFRNSMSALRALITRHKGLLLLPLFLFVYGLATLVATSVTRALMVWAFTFFTATTGIVFALLYKPVNLPYFRKALLIATWIVLLFGIYQYVGDTVGLSTSWTGLREMYTRAIFGFPRIQSTGLEPLFYANFLLIPLFIFSVDFLQGKEEHPFLITLIIMQVCLTVSRGAIIGGGVALIGILLYSVINRVKYIQLASLVALTIAGAFLAFSLTTLIPSQATPGSNGKEVTGEVKAKAIIQQSTNFDFQDDRLRNRNYAIDIFKAYPVLGIGPGNFGDYAKSRYEGYRDYPGYLVVNNEPLEILAESGLLGFVTLASFVAWVLYISYKAIRKLTWGSDNSHTWLVALWAYIVALTIQYQTFSTLYIMHIWIAIGFMIGISITTLDGTPAVLDPNRTSAKKVLGSVKKPRKKV